MNTESADDKKDNNRSRSVQSEVKVCSHQPQNTVLRVSEEWKLKVAQYDSCGQNEAQRRNWQYARSIHGN